MGKRIEAACNWAVQIANDNSHGYDQIHRQGPDYDCSSLCCNAYQVAGFLIKENGGTYTGNMSKAFEACGFKKLPYLKGMTLKRGDVVICDHYKTVNGTRKYYGHAILYLGDGYIVQASINEKGTATGGKTGDQTGREIATGKFYEYSKGWDYVLRYDEDEDQEVQTVEITMTVLNPGAQGSEVTLLQVLLNELGFKGSNSKALTVDGWYKPGGNTEYALVLAQKSFGLTADKICGKKTWTCLLHARYS